MGGSLAQRLCAAAAASVSAGLLSSSSSSSSPLSPFPTAFADNTDAPGAPSGNPASGGGSLGSILGFPRIPVAPGTQSGIPGTQGGIAGRGTDSDDTLRVASTQAPSLTSSTTPTPSTTTSSGGGRGWWGLSGTTKAPEADPSPSALPGGIPGAARGEQQEQRPRNTNPNPRDTAAGFDPEALERGAKALREINKAPNAKQVFEIMRKQEETRQLEEKARLAELQAYQGQQETERQRLMMEEQRKLVQQKAQTEAQLARYNDELARKRMQAEHEAQRVRNAELVKMQEESALKQEEMRRAIEEEIQNQQRQTELQRAEIDRETMKQKAMAEAEARAHEARLSEDVNRRLLLEKAAKETEKWVAAINTTFGHIGGGLRALLTDQNKLIVTVGGVTALAAGVYMTREGSRVLWSYVDRVLGQPSLVRESSMGPYPWSRLLRNARHSITAPFATRALSTAPSASSSSSVSVAAGAGGAGGTTGAAQAVSSMGTPPATGAVATALMRSGKGFGDVVLAPSLHQRIRALAAATSNTRRHGAPFRNMLFHGPPGTGKTMAAKELARQSGLDYALMTGGDVAPLGPQAVTKIHQMFDWASKARKGLLLFIDEADAFLAERNRLTMSEAQRSALNAMLFRTGDQSRDIVLVLATNRPGDLDSAVLDRMDEMLEFPLPKEDERFRLLQMYLHQYVTNPSPPGSWFQNLFRKQERIDVKGITEEVLKEAAERLEGFSGREIAKLMASVRGAVYGNVESVLDADMFRSVVDYKVAEHRQRHDLASHAAAEAVKEKK